MSAAVRGMSSGSWGPHSVRKVFGAEEQKYSHARAAYRNIRMVDVFLRHEGGRSVFVGNKKGSRSKTATLAFILVPKKRLELLLPNGN